MSADGVGVVAHAGSVALRLLADRTGLTAELSKAMTRRGFTPVHDRGRVLTDVAVLLADGGEAIADIDVLRHQSSVLGPVASPATVWRSLDEVTPVRARKIQTALTEEKVELPLDHVPTGIAVDAATRLVYITLPDAREIMVVSPLA